MAIPKPLSKKAQKQAHVAESTAALLKMLMPTTEVYATLKKVSPSGMNRRIALLIAEKGPNNTTQIRNISGWVADVLGLKWNDDGSVSISGCGMDMGFHLVYTLSRTLWPKGFECVGEACRSNDHSNGDQDRKPHHHGDGGYALIHRSL